jgi:NAD(P)-dependent dehydrogenase (short-subunit alcohol dehydrogenase family)
MSRVWVTGSADGIGREIATTLIGRGHDVVLHARDAERAAVARAGAPGAAGIVAADLSTVAGMRSAAALAEEAGPYDAVVHNAGVRRDDDRTAPRTADGLELTFAVNVLAPWLLTTLMPAPGRLVYLSSQMHQGGRPDLDDLQWERRPYNGSQAYSDSKLMVTAIALAVGGDAVDPGWVRTRMGGRGAPRSLAEGADTPVRVALGDVPGKGRYFTGGRARPPHPLAADPGFQAAVRDACAALATYGGPR